MPPRPRGQAAPNPHPPRPSPPEPSLPTDRLSSTVSEELDDYDDDEDPTRMLTIDDAELPADDVEDIALEELGAVSLDSVPPRPPDIDDRDEASIATPLPPDPDDERPTLVNEEEDEPTRMLTLGQADLDEVQEGSDPIRLAIAGEADAAEQRVAVPPSPPRPDEDGPGEEVESLPPAPSTTEPESGSDPLRGSFTEAESTWPDERPAAAHLAERELIDDFVARARWIEVEAEANESPAAKSRALLMASELWAMVGEMERSTEAAQRAALASPSSPLASRQVRWLAAIDGDYRRAVATLEAETRASPNPAARLHGAYLNARFRRLNLNDDEGARQRVRLAAKLDPADPRPHLARLARQLGSTADPPSVLVPDESSLDGLRKATEEVAHRRGGPGADSVARSPGVALQDARRALAEGDADRAAEALAGLVAVEGLDRAALWLAASLLAPRSESRTRAVSFISALLRRERTPMAVRTLLVRALEQGDAKAVQAALEPGDDSSVFSASDQVILNALTGGELESLRPWLDALADQETLEPLAGAAISAALAPGSAIDRLAGEPVDTCLVNLGRALAAGDTQTLSKSIDSFTEEHGDSPLARALTIEMALASGDAKVVAQQLADWPIPEHGGSEAVRDRHLAAALTYEIMGARDDAVQSYGLALEADPACEAAVRAVAASRSPEEAASLLLDLANRVGSETSQALLIVEAALTHVVSDSGVYDALLRRAAEVQPDLPFAASLGERLARSTGNAEALAGWLRLRRLAATDLVEQALDGTREALLVADSDNESAKSLLDDAIQSRPGDAGLRELYERLVPGSSRDKGRWREELANRSEGEARRVLLLTAALEYELDGDREAAHQAAMAAADMADPSATIMAERTAFGTTTAGQLAQKLLEQLRSTEDPILQRELNERLGALELSRGDTASALLHQRAIIEQAPDYLPALQKLEYAYLGSNRLDELEPIATRLIQLLDRREATAHAMLAARHRCASGRWDEGQELVVAALAHGDPHLWTLRQLGTYARVAGDDERQLEADRQLLDRANRPLDGATLALRAAEAAARLGRVDEARELLERAVDMVPDHLVALTTLAEVMENAEEFDNAATALEALARASRDVEHQLNAWHQAAVLWQDKVKDVGRARVALEQAAELDITHEDTVRRLQAIYVELGERSSLAELLERRLEKTDDPDERVALEVVRGRALAEVGDHEAAKGALAAALEANPDHLDALAAYAELCISDEDWGGAEQAWIRLARHATDPEAQAEIYRKLGELYDTQMPNPQRAELAYNEVLKRQPHDIAATERLIVVYGQLEQPERSVEIATELVNHANSPEEKRRRTLGLARVFDEIAQDRKQAEATLDKARKAYPHDDTVIRALASFYDRHDEHRSKQVLLDRATTDARRALHTGRFDPAFFSVLATVAELRGGADAALIANATLAGLRGKDAAPDGAGPEAGNPELDDLLAPELLTLPLRVLLRKAGAALDAAFGFDLKAVRASPLQAEAAGYVGHVEQVASSFGLHGVTLFVTPALGPICVPASTTPPQLVLGEKLMESSDDAARFFLLLRSLKIIQSNGSALSRAAPIDLWPMTAAFLNALCPSWSAPSVDAKRLSDHQARLQGHIPTGLDPDVPTLAMEVAGSIGNRASQLGTAVNQLGNRTALLAIGDINAAFRGIALSHGQSSGPPPEGVDRMKWITRNPEARDLAVFSISEQYIEARRRLGLA